MLKRIVLIIAVAGSMYAGKAQKLTHGLGFGSNYYNVRSELVGFGFGTTTRLNYIFGAGLEYRLSMGFDLSKKASFALSAYPYLGAQLKVYGVGNENILLGAQLPVLAEFYFGPGDVTDEAYFIGGGVNGFHLAFHDDPFTSIQYSFNGLQFSTGGQFYMMGSLMQLRLTYTYGGKKNDIPDDVVIRRFHGTTLSLIGVFRKRP